MSFQFKRRVRFLVRSERGQALPWMVLLTVLFLGMAGLTIDLGQAYVCYRELQASTDAAALAGAQELSASTATSTAVTAAVNAYSSKSGAANANPNLPNPTVATTLLCLTTLTNEGILCSSSPTGNNALKVVQSVTVPTYFIRALSVFGMKSATSMTMTSTATAAMPSRPWMIRGRWSIRPTACIPASSATKMRPPGSSPSSRTALPTISIAIRISGSHPSS